MTEKTTWRQIAAEEMERPFIRLCVAVLKVMLVALAAELFILMCLIAATGVMPWDLP